MDLISMLKIVYGEHSVKQRSEYRIIKSDFFCFFSEHFYGLFNRERISWKIAASSIPQLPIKLALIHIDQVT